VSLTDLADPADLPDDVVSLIGRRRHVRDTTFAAERGHGFASCASVQNGNPLFWDDTVAEELTGGPILPPSTLSLWSRPHAWDPQVGSGPAPLPSHFDLKERFGLPDAVISAAALTLLDPVRPGDRMVTGETLRSVSEEKVTALGSGRFWVIDVDYRNDRDDLVGVETLTGFGYHGAGRPVPASAPGPAAVGGPASEASPGDGLSPSPPRSPRPSPPRRLALGEVSVGDRLPDLVHELTVTDVVLGATAARDWRPMHHDPAFARARSGVANIFLDTPTQQAWFERHLTDWTGPTGRLGRLDLRMGRPVLAGTTMTLSAEVEAVAVDADGCGWVTLVGSIAVDGTVHSDARSRLALPTRPGDNPWTRRGADWLP